MTGRHGFDPSNFGMIVDTVAAKHEFDDYSWSRTALKDELYLMAQSGRGPGALSYKAKIDTYDKDIGEITDRVREIFEEFAENAGADWTYDRFNFMRTDKRRRVRVECERCGYATTYPTTTIKSSNSPITGRAYDLVRMYLIRKMRDQCRCVTVSPQDLSISDDNDMTWSR